MHDTAIARIQNPQTKLPTGELTLLSYWFGKMATTIIAAGDDAAKAATKKREQAREELYTIGRLVETVRLARQGDSFAKQLLELSAMSEDEFEDRQRASMAREQRSVGRMFYEAHTIRLGRRHLIELGISALRRELERVGARDEDFPGLERVIGIQLCKAEDSEVGPGENDREGEGEK